MWNCPKCGTPIDSSFEVCWACGTSEEGIEDPNFVTADDAGPIEDPRIENNKFGLEPELELPSPPLDLVACYQAQTTTEAKFLVDRLADVGIPATVEGGKIGSLYLVQTLSPSIIVRSQDLLKARRVMEDYESRQKLRQTHDE